MQIRDGRHEGYITAETLALSGPYYTLFFRLVEDPRVNFTTSGFQYICMRGARDEWLLGMATPASLKEDFLSFSVSESSWKIHLKGGRSLVIKRYYQQPAYYLEISPS